jgi:hypothetical protein
VLNFTRQEGDNAEAMLLRLFAENWDNNIRCAQYSKCKLLYLPYLLSTEMVVLPLKNKKHPI